MGKALIIAEKPSVANDIAKALGGFTKKDGYFEGEDYILTSAVGHLLEICEPPDSEVKRGKWTFAKLPVIPNHFDLKPIDKTKDRLKMVGKLIKRPDVDSLINACDAGREGELIFRHLVHYFKTQKPIQRLWLQSMTPVAIREGFQRLRDEQAMKPLADAATCRSEADWLVGINGTRAMTAFNSKTGGFYLTPVGRVQTPTLAIVVEREEKIKKFVPRDYWELHATFQAEQGQYVGRWFDESFTKEKNGDPEARAERIWDKSKAESIRTHCLGKEGMATEETKPSSQLPPLLFDLTSLQREAHGRFGFSAQTTLKLAQGLYEKHKVLTYPRTDSRALPEDYQGTVRQTLQALAQTQYSRFAQEILDQGWVRPNKRIFNNAKVSDHFAIIPTSLAPKNLGDMEAKLYDFVAKRFLAIFYPAAEFLLTTRITRIDREPFKTEGKVLVKAGWMAVYGRELDSDNANLAPIQPNEVVQTEDIELVEAQTKPPPRFSEATLLSAMESAGKWVEDEELREAMREKGLGTPATRASIIEGLISEKYLLRNGRELQPTAKAFSLLTLLRGIGIPQLCSPELTGNWEYKLKQMERGELQRPQFMKEIAAATNEIVEKAKSYEHDTVPGDFGSLKTPCPKCGGEVQESYRKFQCKNCDFSINKILAGRFLEPQEAEDLLSHGAVGPIQGFYSRNGRPFAAILKLSPEYKVEFDFGQRDTESSDQEPADFSNQDSLGKCPKCGAQVYEKGMSYVCENAVGNNRTCDFRSGKIILQQAVDRHQMSKLLEQGKTDLLPKFISKKGRPFPAYLVVQSNQNVGFEFAPRSSAKRAGAKKKSSKTSSTKKTPPSQQSS